MATTQSPRPSVDTDFRALLQQDSTAPSFRTASIYTTTTRADGDHTPRAHSPAPSSTTTRHASLATSTLTTETLSPNQSYKGFPSEAAYLRALSAWAEEKKYMQPAQEAKQLKGFYGEKTMDDYVTSAGPRPELGIRRLWRERGKRREEDRERRRRASAAV